MAYFNKPFGVSTLSGQGQFAGTSNEAELGEYAWYKANSEEKTHPVGKKKPNGLGIYDMSGNVWEWVDDRFDEDYYKSSPKDNPQGPASGSTRVLHGGSWFGPPRSIRASARDNSDPDIRFGISGFRLARTAR